MNTQTFSYALGDIDGKYIDEAISYKKKRKHTQLKKILTAAACLCLAVTALFCAINVYAASYTNALFEIETEPPEGLSLIIEGSSSQDIEFHIINDSEYSIKAGEASRVEKKEGTEWVELKTISEYLFPSIFSTLENLRTNTPTEIIYLTPGMELYEMFYWGPDFAEPGSYRFSIVLYVCDEENDEYPVVLSEEFEIEY